MNPRKLLLSVSIVLAGAASAPAQLQYLGYWQDSPIRTWEVYVSPNGTNSTVFGTGTVTNPWRDITFAIQMALTQAPYRFFPVTVNIAPGTYTAPNESFPLAIPAHGITLESYQTNPASPQPATIASGSNVTIAVTSVGNTSWPDSVIRGLSLTADANVIELRPANPNSTVEVATQVRDCTITNPNGIGNGVTVTVLPNTDAFHVIDGNQFVSLLDDAGNTAIQVINTASTTALSSTLIRSNQTRLYSTGIGVTGLAASPQNCRPRICSNFVMQSISNVNLLACNPIVLNNTIAFAANPMVLITATAWGLQWTGGTALTLSNNNLWNPLQPPVALSGPRIDVVLAGQPGATITAFNNNDQDGTLAILFPNNGNRSVGPLFVGGDTHPGLLPTDVHLTLASPLIGAGLAGAVASVRSTLVGARSIRTDVNRDRDFDSRILAGVTTADTTVEIGGDEIADVRVARFVNAAKPLETLDLFGNLRPYAATATTASWRTQVTVTGPAGSVYALYMGTAFYRTIPASGLENGRVFHNITTVFGNLLLEPGPGFLLVGSGAIPAAGNVQVNVDFFTQALGLTETETDVQAFIVPPAGPARLSNRYLIDLNE